MAVSAFASPVTATPTVSGKIVAPSFTTGQITTLRNTTSWLDAVESAGYTIITDGKERMKLFDPFEEAIVELDQRAPDGSASTSLIAGSPGITGKYYYAVTVVNRDHKDSIESAPVRIAAAAEPSSQRVKVDLSGLTQVWGDATHFAIYRSEDRTDAATDPYPVYARLGYLAVGASPLEYNDETADADLDFSNDALNIAKGPPPIAPYIEELKSVVFATGVETLSGTGGAVTNGSATALVPHDNLDRIHIGREIFFGSSERAYYITDFTYGSPNDSITLGDEYGNDVLYAGSSGSKNWYVCGDPTEVRFSEPERPYDWPPANAFQIGRGHGRNTGVLKVKGNLIVPKRTETYAFGFNTHPLYGQEYQLSGQIGCVSNRTLSVDENGIARWLAVGGIVECDGTRVRILSLPIAEKFEEVQYDGDLGDLAPRACAVHDIVNHEYLCAIPTSVAENEIGCREIVVYNYLTGAWSIYELDVEVTSLAQARDDSGYPIVLMGDENGHVWLWNYGATDGVGVPGNVGTVHGTVDVYVASPSPYIQDNDASWYEGPNSPNLDIVGAPLTILSGTGAGQLGVISAVNHSTKRITPAAKFTTRLDTTSVYAIGAIDADYQTGWIDYGSNKVKYLLAVEVSYYIEDEAAEWFLELYVDQPGVATPTIFTYPGGETARHSFHTDGADEPAAGGATSQDAVGWYEIKTGNIPYRTIMWRIRSPYANAPGTFFKVTPINRQGDT